MHILIRVIDEHFEIENWSSCQKNINWIFFGSVHPIVFLKRMQNQSVFNLKSYSQMHQSKKKFLFKDCSKRKKNYMNSSLHYSYTGIL